MCSKSFERTHAENCLAADSARLFSENDVLVDVRQDYSVDSSAFTVSSPRSLLTEREHDTRKWSIKDMEQLRAFLDACVNVLFYPRHRG